MSHFACLVIGDNVADQLQPYHEYECTGTRDEHVQDVDITAEVQASIAEQGSLEKGLEWHGLENHLVDSDEAGAEHDFGYAIVRDGVLVKAVDRTNPKKKWDWWVVGGRYSGRFLLKDGREVDECTFGELDFKAMRANAELEASQHYHAFHAVVGDAPRPESFEEVVKRHPDDVAAARKEYWAQPALARLQAASAAGDRRWLFMDDPEAMWDPLAKQLDIARRRALSAFAIVKDGKWYERAHMGWFGFTSGEMPLEDWLRFVEQTLEALPPDTRLTMVDCHI